jgi:hypothetical protein
MVRVFFADAGSLAQLRGTLEEVEAQALARLDEIRSMIDATDAAGWDWAGAVSRR